MNIDYEISKYYKNKETGKAAHLSRCEITDFLINQDLNKFIELKEAFANLSFGREILAVVKLKSE